MKRNYNHYYTTHQHTTGAVIEIKIKSSFLFNIYKDISVDFFKPIDEMVSISVIKPGHIQKFILVSNKMDITILQ